MDASDDVEPSRFAVAEREGPKIRIYSQKELVQHEKCIRTVHNRVYYRKPILCTEEDLYSFDYIKKCIEYYTDALIFDRSDIHGFGLFSTKSVVKGHALTSYKGITINDPKEAPDVEYIAQVKEDSFLDFTNLDVLTRYVNHSCDPNCELAYYNIDAKDYVVLIVAIRHILPLEEITVDYKMPSHSKRTQCLCGYEDCRGILETQPQRWTNSDMCCIQVTRCLNPMDEENEPTKMNKKLRTGKKRETRVARLLIPNSDCAVEETVNSTEINNEIDFPKKFKNDIDIFVAVTRFGSMFGGNMYSIRQRYQGAYIFKCSFPNCTSFVEIRFDGNINKWKTVCIIPHNHELTGIFRSRPPTKAIDSIVSKYLPNITSNMDIINTSTKSLMLIFLQTEYIDP